MNLFVDNWFYFNGMSERVSEMHRDGERQRKKERTVYFELKSIIYLNIDYIFISFLFHSSSFFSIL